MTVNMESVYAAWATFAVVFVTVIMFVAVRAWHDMRDHHASVRRHMRELMKLLHDMADREPR